MKNIVQEGRVRQTLSFIHALRRCVRQVLSKNRMSGAHARAKCWTVCTGWPRYHRYYFRLLFKELGTGRRFCWSMRGRLCALPADAGHLI